MSISKNVFIHPADKAALAALKAIPGFSQLVKAFTKISIEKQIYIKTMSSCIRLKNNQLPKYRKMLKPICEKIGIEEPELFIELDVRPNAYTTGVDKPFIVMTSGLLETLPEELIPTVLAHECGHIVCHHVLYRTMGSLLLSGSLSALMNAGAGVAKFVSFPLTTAFAYWMRCSEFSADRAAILCDGTPDKMIEVCVRFAGFDKDIIGDIDYDEFMNQTIEYKKLVNENAWNKTIEFLTFRENDHPLTAIRAYEAREWSKTDDFLKSKNYFDSYKASEQPKEIPASWNEKHFVGRNYIEVCDELESFGFDVELIRETKKNILLKDGNVTGVSIGGSSKYKEGDWLSLDSIAEVDYYKQLSEDEIIAMHPGEVKMPNASSYYIGKDYKEVEMELYELGIVNMTIDYVKDIKKVGDKSIGKVASITIDKKPKFSKGDWVSIMSDVVITYHDLID